MVRRGCNPLNRQVVDILFMFIMESGIWSFRETHEKKIMLFYKVQRIESFEESWHVTGLVSIYHSQYLNEVLNTGLSECIMQQTVETAIHNNQNWAVSYENNNFLTTLLPSAAQQWESLTPPDTSHSHKSFKCIMQETLINPNFHETSGVRQKSHSEQA